MIPKRETSQLVEPTTQPQAAYATLTDEGGQARVATNINNEAIAGALVCANGSVSADLPLVVKLFDAYAEYYSQQEAATDLEATATWQRSAGDVRADTGYLKIDPANGMLAGVRFGKWHITDSEEFQVPSPTPITEACERLKGTRR